MFLSLKSTMENCGENDFQQFMDLKESFEQLTKESWCHFKIELKSHTKKKVQVKIERLPNIIFQHFLVFVFLKSVRLMIMYEYENFIICRSILLNSIK